MIEATYLKQAESDRKPDTNTVNKIQAVNAEAHLRALQSKEQAGATQNPPELPPQQVAEGENTEKQPQDIDFGSDIEQPPIVAGVMFSRKAIPAEIGAAQAAVRDVELWISEVAKQQFSTPEERLKAIGEAAQAATSGSKDIPQITPDQAAAMLDEIGITTKQVGEARAKEPSSDTTPTEELGDEQTKAMLAELEAQIGKLKAGDLPAEQFQQAVTEVKEEFEKKGISKDQIAEFLEERGISVRSDNELKAEESNRDIDEPEVAEEITSSDETDFTNESQLTIARRNKEHLKADSYLTVGLARTSMKNMKSIFETGYKFGADLQSAVSLGSKDDDFARRLNKGGDDAVFIIEFPNSNSSKDTRGKLNDWLLDEGVKNNEPGTISNSHVRGVISRDTGEFISNPNYKPMSESDVETALNEMREASEVDWAVIEDEETGSIQSPSFNDWSL